jgi:hypothetical protein
MTNLDNEQRPAQDGMRKRLCQAEARCPAYKGFVERVEGNLRVRFSPFRHKPSQDHWRGIREIIQTIEAMALGVATRDVFLTSLPTGMGKTTTVVECVREIIRIGEATGYQPGVLILTNTLEQIDTLIGAIDLREDQYAVRTSQDNVELNNRGVGVDSYDGEGRHTRATVLFTTQQRLYALTSIGLTMSAMHGLTYDRMPRQVRIWDECILPAEPYVLPVDDIDRLKSPLLKSGFKEARDAIDSLSSSIKNVTSGNTFQMPPIELPCPDKYNYLHDERDKSIVDSLVHMSEARVRITQNDYHGTAAIHYKDILPPDLEPILVCDASGQLRLTYKLWKAHRGNLVELYSPGKTYRNLHIRWWNRGAGKAQHRNPAHVSELASGVASAIFEYPPDESVLSITRLHQKPYQDMQKAIEKQVQRREALEGRSVPERHYRTWGRHLAVNDYAEVKHLVVVGLLQYSAAQAEAMALGAAGLDADDASLTKDDIAQFHLGEIAHHLFQAAGRGAIRKAEGGDVPEGCTLDIVFSAKGNGSQAVTPEILSMTFPGAQIERWDPLPPPLRVGQKKLFQALVERATPAGAPVTLSELAAASGYAEIGTVSKNLRKPAVMQELVRRGIRLEPQPGKPMLVLDVREELSGKGLVGPAAKGGEVEMARPKRRLSRSRPRRQSPARARRTLVPTKAA